MGKILVTFAFVALLAAGLFALEIWEQKCSDETAYGKCSDATPGYYCAQDGSTLALQKVVGEVNPVGHPKAGEPTTLSIQCACEKYAGYVEKNGECVDSSNVAVQEPEVVETPKKDEPPIIVNETSHIADGNNKPVIPALVQQVGADLLTVPDEKPAVPEEKFELGTIGTVGIIVAASVVGGLLIIGLIVAAIYVSYKLKKRRKGL